MGCTASKTSELHSRAPLIRGPPQPGRGGIRSETYQEGVRLEKKQAKLPPGPAFVPERSVVVQIARTSTDMRALRDYYQSVSELGLFTGMGKHDQPIEFIAQECSSAEIKTFFDGLRTAVSKNTKRTFIHVNFEGASLLDNDYQTVIPCSDGNVFELEREVH